MKMFVSRGEQPNFGDDLNDWLWPKIFAGFWNDSHEEIFLGIGSILYDSFPCDQKKVVFGSGYGGYTEKPNVHDGSWDVYFVRGPQTTEALGLDLGLALTDAAILIRTVAMPRAAARSEISFMPHYESVKRGNWKEVCRLAGIRFVDPRHPVDTVLGQILGSELLLTEAMHGAIVADALRVPWIPLRPISESHHFKWTDWTRSVELPWNPVSLRPSSSREAWMQKTGRQAERNAAKAIASSVIGRTIDAALIPLAANSLTDAAKGRSYLSDDRVIERLTERVTQMADRFRRDFGISGEGT